MGPRAWQEWNVNELTDLSNHDDISGFPVYKALLCNLVKIEDGDEATRRSAGRTVTGSKASTKSPSKPKNIYARRVYSGQQRHYHDG